MCSGGLVESVVIGMWIVLVVIDSYFNFLFVRNVGPFLEVSDLKHAIYFFGVLMIELSSEKYAIESYLSILQSIPANRRVWKMYS